MILRSFCFNDEPEPVLVKQLIEKCTSLGHEAVAYNMPAYENIAHWAGFAVCDFTNRSDLLICIDFPTALVKHQKKKIILTKPLPAGQEYRCAVDMAIKESESVCKYVQYAPDGDEIDYDCPVMPGDMHDIIDCEVI